MEFDTKAVSGAFQVSRVGGRGGYIVVEMEMECEGVADDMHAIGRGYS